MIENLDNEVWKQVKEFPRYYVSNKGRVKSCIGIEKLLQQYCDKGYMIVKLSREPSGKGLYNQRSIKVHRLVAEYFCTGFEKNKQVHHIDRNRNNNNAANLICLSKAEHAEIHRQLNKKDKEEAAKKKAASLIF